MSAKQRYNVYIPPRVRLTPDLSQIINHTAKCAKTAAGITPAAACRQHSENYGLTAKTAFSDIEGVSTVLPIKHYIRKDTAPDSHTSLHKSAKTAKQAGFRNCQKSARTNIMIKSVIFDMDGVLIDSEICYLKYDLAFARTKNPNVTIDQLYGMVGASKEPAWRIMAQAIDNGQTWQELRDEYRASIDVFAQVDYRTIFRPEVIPVLESLKSNSYSIALASSTQMDIIERVLSENQITDYFQVIVTGNQFKESKPNPEIYHYTASRLNTPENQCLVIEDSTLGITAAARAGMTVAALIDDRFGFDRSLADYEIASLTEIPGLLGIPKG